jgi:membrane dipeptidase
LQIAELYRCGWTKHDLQQLAGGNLLRVMQGAEKVAADLQQANTPPVVDVYKRRSDLPIQQTADEL